MVFFFFGGGGGHLEAIAWPKASAMRHIEGRGRQDAMGSAVNSQEQVPLRSTQHSSQLSLSCTPWTLTELSFNKIGTKKIRKA